MAKETIPVVVAAARTKARLLARSPLQYLVLSMLAGAYIGFAIILIFSIGAPLAAAGSAAVKLVMGASFGIALALVIFAGSELFTGNNMVMTVGSLSGEVSWGRTAGVWAASWVGNLAGSLLLAYAAVQSGLVTKAPIKDFIGAAALAKTTAPFGELFVRGILCNTLVCLAVWTALRTKDDTAKLGMIFWCLFAFIAADAAAIFASVPFDAQQTAVIVDPPRKGCGPAFMAQLAAFAPRTIVYVSCNPETQAPEIAALRAAGYRCDRMRPFDMFPQTRHVECVATLSRAPRD